jgi:excisionase family DNA binding protein
MEDLLTTKQVQELFQVDRITIYRMVKDGRLNGFKVGKQWRFQRSQVQELITGPATPEPLTVQSYTPSEVLPVHCINVIQDVFADMTDVGSLTTDVAGEPLTAISNSCEFCNLMQNSPSGLEACKTSWRELAQSPKGAPQFFQCHAGLQYARGRIELDGQLTAIQVAGQFLITEPDKDAWKSHVSILADHHQISKENLTAAGADIRIKDKATQQQIGNWLEKVADTFEIIAHERANLIDRLNSIAAISSLNI